MPNKYAKSTEISIDQSQREIETLLRKYGATKFAINYATDEIIFEIHGVAGKIFVPKPNLLDSDIQKTETGLQRTETAVEKAYQQKLKQRWRVMILLLRASLESVECGILSVEQALLPHLLTLSGKRVADVFHESISPTMTQGLLDH